MSKKNFEDSNVDLDDLNMEEAHNILDDSFDEDDQDWDDEDDVMSLNDYMTKHNKERR